MVKRYSQIQEQTQIIHRILDANLDRAREGMRIIEEWCRFGLSDRDLSERCKQIRQELASWHSFELRMARDTQNDPGTDLSHPQEESRSSIENLLQANLCRVEEALRVLEEYGKLYKQDMGKSCKQMRYQVYTLETDLFAYRCRQKLQESLLYLVTSESDRLIPIVEAALAGGLSLVQYRDKHSDDSVKLANAEKLCQLCHQYDALFIVNDRVDIAIAVNADGVHLGQQDLSVTTARKILGSSRIIGCSTTNIEEMERAIAQGADYIGVGPIYATPTKPGKNPAGIDYLTYVAKNCDLPWFAIGGIDTSNINEVLTTGASRIAVVRAIMQAEEPTRVTQYLLSQLHRDRAKSFNFEKKF
ncbi:MAG: thiamine phosphate synthase [Prochloraceae cyanobacterium]